MLEATMTEQHWVAHRHVLAIAGAGSIGVALPLATMRWTLVTCLVISDVTQLTCGVPQRSGQVGPGPAAQLVQQARPGPISWTHRPRRGSPPTAQPVAKPRGRHTAN